MLFLARARLVRRLAGTPSTRVDSPAISPPPYCTEFEYGDFLAPGPRSTQTVRRCTEKRPSSRPLLLPNRPLSAVYMPYLLSYCARAAVVPRSCRCWPSLALACAALVSCAMGRGEWLCCCCICCIAALYLLLLLHLLLLLLAGLCVSADAACAAAALPSSCSSCSCSSSLLCFFFSNKLR